MDRWENADDDITPVGHSKGRVARMGIAGFVQAAVLASEQPAAPDPTSSGIVIVDSKREQRAAAARQAMPPPPTLAAKAASNAAAVPAAAAAAANIAPTVPRPAVPAGSLPPPPGTLLLVHKAGTLVQQIPITETMTVFGRLPCNNVVLDHPSSSRQHAALTFRRQQGSTTAILCDLGSAHGTFIRGRRVTRGQPCPLSATDTFHFGASTRTYSIQIPPPAAAGDPLDKPAGKKRARVTFAGDAGEDERAAAAAAAGGTDKRQALEQVIGYTDSKQFTPRVGPQAASAEAGEQGKFAHMLESKVVIVKAKPQQQQQQQQQQPPSPQQRQQLTGQLPGNTDQPGQRELSHQADAGQAAVQQQQQQQDKVESLHAADSTELGRSVSDPAVLAGQQQQQQGSTLPPAAPAVVRSWSGGASRMLLPPQLARKISTLHGSVTSTPQQQGQRHQHQQGVTLGSSLYDQLPQAAAAKANGV